MINISKNVVHERRRRRVVTYMVSLSVALMRICVVACVSGPNVVDRSLQDVVDYRMRAGLGVGEVVLNELGIALIESISLIADGSMHLL